MIKRQSNKKKNKAGWEMEDDCELVKMLSREELSEEVRCNQIFESVREQVCRCLEGKAGGRGR